MSGGYYAVRRGRNTGVYYTWNECRAQVDGFSRAIFKKFSSLNEAREFAYSTSNRYHPYSRGVSGGRDFTLRRHLSHATSSTPVVYCDGCCYSNGKRGAKGGIGVFWGDGSEWNVSERLEGKQTNQRAELISASRALEIAIRRKLSCLEIRTDSLYTINAVTRWSQKWISNGWKTTSNEPVQNKDDIVHLLELCNSVNVTWTHVKGHIGIHGNERADKLAKEGSEK